MSHPATTLAHRALDIILASSAEDKHQLREYLCTVSNLTLLPTQSQRAMEAYRTLLGIKEPTPLQELVRCVLACAVKDVGAYEAVLPGRLKRAEEMITNLLPDKVIPVIPTPSTVPRELEVQSFQQSRELPELPELPQLEVTLAANPRYQQAIANQIAARDELAINPGNKGAQLGLADNVLDEVMLRMDVAGILPNPPIPLDQSEKKAIVIPSWLTSRKPASKGKS